HFVDGNSSVGRHLRPFETGCEQMIGDVEEGKERERPATVAGRLSVGEELVPEEERNLPKRPDGGHKPDGARGRDDSTQEAFPAPGPPADKRTRQILTLGRSPAGSGEKNVPASLLCSLPERSEGPNLRAVFNFFQKVRTDRRGPW